MPALALDVATHGEDVNGDLLRTPQEACLVVIEAAVLGRSKVVSAQIAQPTCSKPARD